MCFEKCRAAGLVIIAVSLHRTKHRILQVHAAQARHWHRRDNVRKQAYHHYSGYDIHIRVLRVLWKNPPSKFFVTIRDLQELDSLAFLDFG